MIIFCKKAYDPAHAAFIEKPNMRQPEMAVTLKVLGSHCPYIPNNERSQ
jgi:hypothetical protein